MSNPPASEGKVPRSSTLPEPTAAFASPSAPVVLGDESLPRPFGGYVLEELLGSGGMGRVYLAYETALTRRVALKMPTPVRNSAEWREQFQREAQAAAKLEHPNICPIYGFGEVNGQPFFTMKYIEGKTLAVQLKERGRFVPAEAAQLLLTVARALAVAHCRKEPIVHRDLKPGNVMIVGENEPIVVDFGLAMSVAPANFTGQASQGMGPGTPAYMAPEQLSQKFGSIQPHTDVYALGVILYELVTGRKPFEASSVRELCVKIAAESPPLPSTLNPDVAPALEGIIQKAMAKDPARRFRTAAELATALDAYLRGPRFVPPPPVSSVPPLSQTDVPTHAYSLDTTPSVPVAAPRRARWKWPLVGVAALGAFLLAAAVAIALRPDRKEPETQNNPNVPRAPDQPEPPNPGPGLGPKVGPPKPTIVLPPNEGTQITVPGWEYLIDANRAGTRKWLDAHKVAGNSVAWLDAYPVGDTTKFAALAALDGRKIAWETMLRAEPTPPYTTDAGQPFDSKTFELVSQSGYTEGDQFRSVRLWRPGLPPVRTWPCIDTDSLKQNLAPINLKDAMPLQIRPVLWKRQPVWASHTADGKGKKAEHRWNVPANQAVAFLDEFSVPGMRPGSVAGCEHNGGLVFGATAFADKDAMKSEYALSLTAEELKAKAEKLATDGFTPVSLTGYHTKGGTRFCAVWVKYTPMKPTPTVVLDSKEGMVIAVPGWEYLVDATHAGAKKWLDAHKAAKHSVMWLDAYQIGEKPRFAALAALDSRQPDWVAGLEVNYNLFAHNRTQRGMPEVDLEKHSLVCQSYYREKGDFVAVLWHPGTPNSHSIKPAQRTEEIKQEVKTGQLGKERARNNFPTSRWLGTGGVVPLGQHRVEDDLH
ncbi:MAG: protein kinase, partial [Planctomycetia bacterium]|nr:protein kinase [Planctomycetia bacterium]